MGTLDVKVGRVTVVMIDDDRICLSIKSGVPFEPDSLKVWAEMCKPGTEVLDVGAYSGLFSIAAAKLGARPVAIEPLPQMVDRLIENAVANEVKIMLIRGAASDVDEKSQRIGFNERVFLTSGASLSRKGGAGINVHVIRIDSLNMENVSAIKIDVERHEVNVLQGAMKLINKCLPKLMIETLDADARKAVEGLLPMYRTVAFLDHRNLILDPK